ncbi:hypothetical protein A7X67_00625 [Clostridium sp. W14A]|nr:hypothetical protein A7X67_00625 [Clostridium sp. W14A]
MKGAKIARKYLGGGDLAALFEAIENEQKNYNWVVTDHDFFTREEPLKQRLSWTGVFFTGEELTELFVPRRRVTFIDAVLSAYPKEIPVRELQTYELPEWQSPGYWQEDLELQTPQAVMELVPWDGYELLFLSRRDGLVDSFLRAFPQALDLGETNRREKAVERRITEIFHRAAKERGILLTEKTEKYKYSVFQSLCRKGDKENLEVTDEEIGAKVERLLRGL